MDIRGDSVKPRAQVIMYKQKHDVNKRENQLWYEDEKSIIRAKLNGFVLDASGNLGCFVYLLFNLLMIY